MTDLAEPNGQDDGGDRLDRIEHALEMLAAQRRELAPEWAKLDEWIRRKPAPAA